VLRIRYKEPQGIRARLFLNISQCPPRVPGRVLRINKVSTEEQWHVGEFNMMPKVLMREFRQKQRKQGIARKFEQVEEEMRKAESEEQMSLRAENV